MKDSGAKPIPNAKAVIVPHAGYSYSAPTAAYSFGSIPIDDIKRIFVLGPCHRRCSFRQGGLGDFTAWETLFGDLKFDVDVVQELSAVEGLDMATNQAFTAEHSLEMQMPFLKTIVGDRDVKIVPIMIAEPLPQAAIDALSRYMADPETFFVISSDFCHWGAGFGYTHVAPGHETIGAGIAALDQAGIDAIASADSKTFINYLQATGNTICGRVPIMTVMQALEKAGVPYSVRRLHYEMSDPDVNERGQSVSYVAAAMIRG